MESSNIMSFQELVRFRKSYEGFEDGFMNPSQIENGRYDQAEAIDPWNRWHSSIPADILVIGQDWGSQDYYVENEGSDNDSNPTCKNLATLFEEIGIEIGTPSNPSQNSRLFFANIIPAVRTGKMSGNTTKITVKMVKKYATLFIEPLIQILNPKIIITLGKNPLIGLCEVLDLDKISNIPLSEVVGTSPIWVNENLIVAPMFHCGSLGLANRNLQQQKLDWAKLGNYIGHMKKETSAAQGLVFDRNSEAQRKLQEISSLVIRLQEVFAIEAILNDMRLSDNGKEYIEQWRLIRSEGNDLKERLRSLTDHL